MSAKRKQGADSRKDGQTGRNLVREKEFSNAVINSMPGVFYLFDIAGRFLRWNRNFEQVSGYSASELAHLGPLDFFLGEDKTAVASTVQRVFTEGQARVEANFVSKDGRQTPYLFVGLRMCVEGTSYLIGSGVDMSGRKEARDTQRATVNMLEDFDEERAKFQMVQKATLNLLEDFHEERSRLGLTQAALINILEDVEVERSRAEQAKVLMEAINKELEAFSYSVQHDLRAPLRAISGFVDALVEDCAPRLDDEGKRYLGLIQQNAHRMGQLIDDLLAFSRLGRQQMIGMQIDMAALAEESCNELRALTPGRLVDCIIDPVPPARGDRAMIRQVLVNLFSNALKFTRGRERARIEFGYQQEAGRSAYYVRDNGVGFDMEYVGKLFGVFQRLHSAAEFEGTGVGLALVNRIITRHGGQVWAEGRVDEGAVFYFTLPDGDST